jgi:hypothetical protein
MRCAAPHNEGLYNFMLLVVTNIDPPSESAVRPGEEPVVSPLRGEQRRHVDEGTASGLAVHARMKSTSTTG